MTTPYAKPWLSIPDQLQKLKDYGLVVGDEAAARDFLRHLNYYRFSGYGLAFEAQRHAFRPGTTFEAIQNSYYFDRALRDLVTESLEVIELDLRSAVAHDYGQAHGAFGHTAAANFFRTFDHVEWLDKLHEETERSNEVFVAHFKSTYSQFPDLPIWAAMEIISFGALSKMFSFMLKVDQKTIAARYNLQPATLASWIHHLVYTRNLCAHHARIWDRKWAIMPDLPPGNMWQPPALPGNARLFATLLVQSKLLLHCKAEKTFAHEWKQRVEALVDGQMPNVPDALARMGMPADWKRHPQWICL